MSKRVSYVHDDNLLCECDKLPAVPFRASMVHALIESYGLLEHMNIIPNIKAALEDLRMFHSSDYLEFIKNAHRTNIEEVDSDQEEYGLCYDCPLFENIFDTLASIAGGSLTAALSLINEESDIVINWNGGWHHAQRDQAEGFCYINDIVIAIEKLKEKYTRILYIDLDIHHGDGVENAFAYTKKVFTLSFHKFEPGFYPGTGDINEIGYGNGKGYSCNIPFKEGISDDSLQFVFMNIHSDVFNTYRPEAIVVQCGGDCLKGDPLGQGNLTHISLGKCVDLILKWNKPTMFLGGGGYNFANTARLWTYLTAIITEQENNISMDIPDHNYFLKYGPDYSLPITKGCQKDNNDPKYLETIIQIIRDNLSTYCK